MPEKYTPFKFKMSEDEPIVFEDSEHYECPKCRWRVPVMPQHFDYRVLYDESVKYREMLSDEINGFLLEAQKEVPEFKIYCHNKKAILFDKIKKLKEIFSTDKD
ncbi:MAG: hypothetical protein GY861_15580 [bacterium]|nr:hypothetical protein [bacterium]